ncbi:hypothetical protein M0R45_005322 [Rubus argutus]|uniref:Uncharacterized protein n=1 Tax=Rubus argutus TaxID=59490 RepID=A0AAW1YME8_RUBAR
MDPPLNFNLLMDLLGFDAEDHDFDLDLVPHAAIDDDVYIDMEELFADAVVDDDLDLEAFLDSVIDSDTTTIPGAVNAEKLMADFTPEKGYELGDCSICLETLHEVIYYSFIQMSQSQRPILFGVMKMAWILRFLVVWQGLNEELVVAGHVEEIPIKDQVSSPCFVVILWEALRFWEELVG